MGILTNLLYQIFLFSLLSISFTTIAADYVGSKSCVDCHEQAYQSWQGSHHQLAMQHADETSMLGDFNNVSFKFDGKENRFYRKGEQYWVNIEGPDGQFHDYHATSVVLVICIKEVCCLNDSNANADAGCEKLRKILRHN